jgi:predicted nucleic acid-binding protein
MGCTGIDMYVDSNIFIFASIDNGELGDRCTHILEMISQRKIVCACSYLVVDEVAYILKKNVGKEDALVIIKAILSLPLRWIDVNRSVIIGMVEQMENMELDPRDSIHLASMKAHGIGSILTYDRDFEGIDGITRIPPNDLAVSSQ